MILAQPTSGHGVDTNTIERLNHVDVKLPFAADDEEEHVYYAGQKNPLPPVIPEPYLADDIQTC